LKKEKSFNELDIRERPFNLKGGGGVWFLSKKIFCFPLLLKKYSDFGGGKKN
jgi:hypothetical protein